jgi:serine protease AprX
MNRTFRSNVNANNVTDNFTIDYNPATTATNDYTINVAAGTTAIEAKIRTQGVAGETGNPVNLSLISPSGAETRSGIPVLFALSYDRGVAVASPEPGTWTVRVSGLNGAAFPEKISGVVNMMTAAGTSGLSDIAGHPAEASIMMAVSARLADGLAGGGYKPDELLKRIDMADYLVMGEAIRQYLPVDGTYTLTDVKERNLIAESVTARGAALRDKDHVQNGIMLAASPGKFNPNGKVNRAELAYSLVQALGLQAYALERNGKAPSVEYNGKSYPIEDAATIPAGFEGYVSVALELNMINAFFTATQGQYDLEPVLHASFKPLQDVTRADFAVIITRTHGLWNSGQQPLAAESTSNLAISEEGKLVSYPNPFSELTTIRYAVEQDGLVTVEVFDILGKKVRTLVSESKTAGNHSVDFRAENLPAGTYIYKVEAGNKVYSNKMLLAK